MGRIAFIAFATLLISGVPCLHEAYAMEQTSFTPNHTHVTSMPTEAYAHRVSAAEPSGSALRPLNGGGVCCIKDAPAGSEANEPTTRNNAAPITVTGTCATTVVAVDYPIETHHPPDFQSPYHKRTTCQRE